MKTQLSSGYFNAIKLTSRELDFFIRDCIMTPLFGRRKWKFISETIIVTGTLSKPNPDGTFEFVFDEHPVMKVGDTI